MRNNSTIHKLKYGFLSAVSAIIFTTVEVYAQMPQPPAAVSSDVEAAPDNTWQYILLFVLTLGAGAIYWIYANRKAKNATLGEKSQFSQKHDSSVDADKELEWLRRNKKLVGSNTKNISKKAASKGDGNKFGTLPANKTYAKAQNAAENKQAEVKEAKVLPVFSFQKLERSKPFDKLTISNDPALMSAVEQVQDEFEEDEAVRQLAVKILKAFRTRNSAEALSQVALYDLSSFLRSKAIAVLADFNHESVFETILLACADPAREVRAAAARGLFQVKFDRADAWTRISETDDEFRIKQAARAALEADLGERYFDRLVHRDVKSAYEAFAFVALLLKSDETESVFKAMQKHRDINVRKAILHVIKVTKEPNALEGLYGILENDNLPPEMREEADRLVEEIGMAVI